MKRLFKVLVVLSLTVMILMNMASCKSVLDKTPYLDGPTASNEVTSDLGDQTTPEETPVVTDDPTTEPATEPVTVPGTDPEVTEPEVTEPEVTEPEVTEPEVTSSEPEVTSSEPEVTSSEPEVTSSEPEVTSSEPEVTSSEPEVTSSEPEVTSSEPEVTSSEPEVTSSEPEVTDPEVDPDLPKPVENKVTVSIVDYATENGWINETTYLSIIADKNITITAATSKNNTYTGKYYTNGNDWRIYQTDGGFITITAADGKTIVSVKITYKSQKNGTLLQGETSIKSGDVVSVNGNSITLSVGNTGTATNGQARITSIEIIYLGEAEAPTCQHTGAEAVRENEVGATCSTEGSYDLVVYCSKCGDELSREPKTIDKLKHTPSQAVIENEVPATCTKEGSYDSVVYCSVCTEQISRESKTTEKTEHVMSGWDIVKDSTCKEKGTKTRECTVCDYKETVDIPTKNHNYDDNDICVDCGSVNDGHQHTYESVVTPPTCTAEGYTTHTCACGESYKDNTVPATHTPAEAVEENKVGATCSKEGSYESVVYCSKCGYEISREPKTIGKLAHTMGVWEVTTAPTCTTKGVETSKCKNCDHVETKDVDTIAHTPAEAVEENKVDATCSKEGSYYLVVYCSVCKTEELSREPKTIDKLEHTGYETDYKCDVCSTIVPPQTDSALTIEQAITLSKLYSSEAPTAGKYYLSGIITEIYNTTYGNMYITDGTNTIIVYGVYSEDGNTRYDAMTVKPAVGDKITVYGVLGQHDKKAQMINGWMTELCKHSYTETERVNATCTAPGSVTELCSECGHIKITTLPVIDHNYENGQCTECEKVETIVTDATISFDNKNNRVEYTTSQQIWVQNGITVTNNKDKATSNIGDYSNPARFYKGSTVIIAYPGMTKIVINCTTADYAKVWESIEGVTAIRSNTTVTITFNAPTDSFTASMSAKSFVSSITVYSEVEKCLHKETVVENAADATCTTDGYTGDTVCLKCGETVNEGTTIPATDHTHAQAVKENEVPASCSTEGSYESVVYCSKCGDELSRESKTIDKLEHTPAQAVIENEVDATCTKEGSYDSVVYCSVCTEQISREPKTIDKLAHTMGAWEETTAPTCTKKGVETSKCENCDYFETRDKDTLDHTPGAEATCTTPQTCTGCDYVFVNALNHTPGAAATCTTAQTCTKCGETLVAAFNHADENNDNICDRENCKALLCGENNHIEDDGTVTKDATCTEKGEKTYKCTACGNTLRTEEIPATGHAYIDHEAQAPTCTDKGWEAYQTCEKCKYNSYVEIPATGHATTKAYTVIDGVLYYAAICGCEDQREVVKEGTIVEIANEADLKTVLTAGYSVVLTDNIELTSAIEIEGKQVVINLGGYTITADWVDENGVVEVLWAKGTGTVVTINGEGSMKSGTGSGTNSVVSSTDGAIVNINGGYYYSASYGAVIATTRNGVVNIYGGKFEAAEQCEGKWYVLDIDERVDPEYFGEINVYGGEFVNYDPVNNNNDNADLANKVADGYHSIYNEETSSYVVSAHNYNAVETHPTCEEDGYTTHTCVCGDEYTDTPVDAIGHKWDNNCDTDCNNNCGTIRETTHTPGEEATCEDAQTCTECGATITPAFGHDYVDHAAQAATCIAAGWKAYQTCENCEYNTKVEIPATGVHTYSYGTCTGCDKTFEFIPTTEEIEFELGKDNTTTGHKDNNTSKETYSETVDGYTLSITNASKFYPNSYDETGKSCIKLGTGSETASFSFTVPDDVIKVIIYVAGYKANEASVVVNGKTYAISSKSNNGVYTAIEVETIDAKTISFSTNSSPDERAMINTIVFNVVTQHVCTSDNQATCEEAARCLECGEYVGTTLDHTPGTAATCTTPQTCTECGTELQSALGHTPGAAATCTTPQTCTKCGETVQAALDHAWDHACDTDCNRGCGETRETEHTFVDGTCTACGALDHVHSYGNGAVTAPTCTVNGYTTYSCSCGDSYTDNEVPATGHAWANATCTAPKTCGTCGATEGEALAHNYNADVIAPTCGTAGYTTHTCSTCGDSYTDSPVAATGEHSFTNGKCACGLFETTISFDDTANRTSFSTSQQVWEQNGITVTNNKASSTTNVANYYNPVRFYKNSQIIITYTGMTKIVITCGSSSYATTCKNSISTNEGVAVSVSGSDVTITFSTTVDSFEFTASSGQIQIKNITVYSQSEPPKPCEHTNTTVEGAIAATCTTAGHTGTTICSDCEKTIDEGETIPVTDHDYVDGVCSSCGAEENAGGGEVAANKTKYTFSTYTAGTQYAQNEKHTLDSNTTLIINGAHLNTQVRLYSGSNAIIQSIGTINKITVKAGYKAGTLTVYVSNDGTTWTKIQAITTTTSYTEYTVDLQGSYNYIKLESSGAQIRVSELTINP